METYREMVQRHQAEVDALPIHFAYSDKQFAEEMAKMGLAPEHDLDKIYRFASAGFYKKTDSQLVIETFKRIQKETDDAVAADMTGEGFIYQMWLTELEDHEYGYTRDASVTMDILGYTREDLENNPALKKGLSLAIETILERTNEAS